MSSFEVGSVRHHSVCPICLTGDSFLKVERSAWLVCSDCGVQVPNTKPASGVLTNNHPGRLPTKSDVLSRCQVRLARKLIGKRDLYDFGCGNGRFLNVFRKQDQCIRQYLGIELDSLSVAVARKHGLKVESVIPSRPQNTLITMWHSAEHLAPEELRGVLHDLWDPTNLILISVPNGESTAWTRHGEQFAFFDPTAHMAQYTYKSLQCLVESAGWKIATRHRSMAYGVFSSFQTAINLRRPRNELYFYVKRHGQSPPIMLLISNMLALFATLPQLLVLLASEFKMSRSSTITVALQVKETF